MKVKIYQLPVEHELIAAGDKKIDNSRDPNIENHSRDQPELMDFIETYFWEPD